MATWQMRSACLAAMLVNMMYAFGHNEGVPAGAVLRSYADVGVIRCRVRKGSGLLVCVALAVFGGP
jgi:hypothetical protein